MPLPTAGTGRNKLRAKKSCEDLGLGGRCPHQPHHPVYCVTNNIGAPVCFLVNAPEKWPKQQAENRPSKDQISLFRCGKGTQRHAKARISMVFYPWYFSDLVIPSRGGQPQDLGPNQNPSAFGLVFWTILGGQDFLSPWYVY